MSRRSSLKQPFQANVIERQIIYVIPIKKSLAKNQGNLITSLDHFADMLE